MTPTNYPPVGEVEGKKKHVERMFDTIAPRYDLLNRLLSLGIDRWWRREMIRELNVRGRVDRLLDVATGTGDVAIAALRLTPEKVVGIDLSEEMLTVGRKKIAELGFASTIDLLRGDAEDLAFDDGAFDAVTAAFGVRNFENLGQGLSEMLRVLRPGGTMVVLEFSSPQRFPMKQLYGFYSRHVLPRVGSAVSKDQGAYSYLPDSAAAFPFGERMVEIIRDVGFEDVACRPLTFGIVSVYTASAPQTGRGSSGTW